MIRVKVGPGLTEAYLSAAVTDHQPMIANILIVWCILLRGNVVEETFWTVDKS